MSYKKQSFPFHLVDPSPWPITTSMGLGIMALGGVIKQSGLGGIVLVIGFGVTVLTTALWWRDCIREGTYTGDHTNEVRKGINLGFQLFIVSELALFGSIFWAYLHSSLSVSVELGANWPPKGVEALNIWELPIFNTIVLLSSAAAVTVAHHGIINRERAKVKSSLLLTILLAVIFIACQGIEYWNCPFTITSGVYGSTFFFGTGLHGLHIIIGTILLAVALIRIKNYSMTDRHNINLDFAVIYWLWYQIRRRMLRRTYPSAGPLRD